MHSDSPLKIQKRKRKMTQNIPFLSKPTPLWLPVLICIVLVIAFIYIVCKLRKKLSKHDIDYKKIKDRRSFSLNEWDLEKQREIINGGDGDDHSSKVERVASDHRGALRLREIEAASNGRIGSGELGVVYYGLLMDDTRVAIKNLFSNRREEKDFCVLAEAMLLIRHKNLVKLLGYCAEGPHRMLVHEYVGNGDLGQWLHNCTSKVSPLTWSIRMQIINGIAKGLAYLHDETKPPVTHFNLKSSNVLVDQQWNPKISNIGTTKLLGPEYDCTHVGDERSDVYNFGVLIMEIVSGKTPIQTYGNEIEEHLVDWIKYMVDEKNFGPIVDPSLPELPTVKEVKRVLFIAMRCVDSEAKNRPKMREIVHMLRLHGLLLWNM